MVMRTLSVVAFAILLIPACASSDARVEVNPYADLDWQTLEIHKANLHTHTTESDGDFSPQEVVDMYAEAGYTILSLTDHDTHEPEHSTWPWEEYGIDVDASGMLPIEGNEISRPDHIGSYFNDYGDADQRSVSEALEQIGKRDGLAVMFHPGRYRNVRDPQWYVDLYEDFPHLLGMEVFNQDDRYPGDRAIYDQVISELMPERPVWAMANDDFHSKEHFARSMNFFLLPEEGLNEENFREAFEKGRFYAVYNPSRDTGEIILPEQVRVNEEAIELVVECDDDQVVWISHGHEIHRGRTLPLSTNIGDYVRATLKSDEGTVTLLQPFGIAGTEDRVMTELTIIGGSGSGEYLTGSRGVSIEADDPAEGKVFDRWTGDIEHVNDVEQAETTVDLPEQESVEIEAEYRPTESYTLDVEHGEGSGDVKEESHHWIQASIPQGYIFDEWTGDVEPLESPRSPTTRLQMPNRDFSVTATFTPEEEVVFAPQLQNPSFQDGIEGWDAEEDDVRIVENDDDDQHLALLRFSGIMQRVDDMELEAGTRLTLYFDAKIEAEDEPVGFVGMQYLGELDEELAHTSITVRNQSWTPLAVSAVLVEEVIAPNIFVWMRDGELHLRNFRLRVHDSGG